jgi:Tol biopolymer transport system component
MQTSEDNLSIYRFGDFVLNANTRVLSRDGETIPLTPRVLDTLLAFVTRPGETITKDELMSSIWPDSFVEEANLTQNVAVLRKALGENPRQHRYIVTVPGKGYRFVPEVIQEYASDSLAKSEGEQTPPVSPGSPPVAPARPSPLRGRLIMAGAAITAVLGVAAAYFYFGGGTLATPSVARTRQITSFSGLDLYPAFAPNTNSLAYTSNKTGAFEIFIRQLVPGASEIQLTSDGNHNFQPAFSPDGSRIAYYSVQRGGIWVVPSSGGTPKRLTGFGSNPAWSPDGNRIVFQSDPLNEFGSGVRSAMPPSTLWTVSSDGTGEPVQLTSVGTPPGGHGSPDWSPDGKTIIFDSNDWASSSVWSIGADGTGLVPVLDSPAVVGDNWFTASDAVFSRDGKSIFFVGDMGISIQTVGIDSSGRALGSPVKLFDASAARVRHIAVAPDGKRLVYSAISTSSNLYLTELNVDGTSAQPKQLTRSTDARAVSPSFSPDGKTIAFQEYTTGSSATVVLIDTEGSNSRQISRVPSFNPWWFPSGDRVGFSVPRGRESEYWFATADGSVEKMLFKYDDTDVFNGRLSADGRSVLFNSKRSGTINIWQIPIDGGAAKQITFDSEMAGFPTMSRDGRWIAVQLKRGGDTHVAVMPAEGGELIQLTDEPGQSWVNDWAPDNDRILFAGRRGTTWNVYSVSRTTREIKQLTNFDNLQSYVRYPAWSPLGDKIAYEYAESTGNLWMIELK